MTARNRVRLALFATVAACALLPPSRLRAQVAPAATARAVERVRIETSAGIILVEVDHAHAPLSAGNFMRYVNEGRYDGGAFYRTVTPSNQPRDSIRIEVIQGGLDRDGSRRLPPIAHETTEATGIRHNDGTLSMARSGPGTASSEFFIVIGAQPALDFGGMRNPDGQGFATFGRVISGMDVVRRIQAMPADSAPPQRIREPVRIVSMRVVP